MLPTAIAAAQAAGHVLRCTFGQEVTINHAEQHDLKIQADIDCQKLIEDIILTDFPSHRILGEEGDAGARDAEIEWIVDPIDGTVNFAMGYPHFCVSIAARRKPTGQTLVGVIYDPLRNELFTAEAGKQTRLNGRRIDVSPRAALNEAMVSIGFAKTPETVQHCLKLYAHYGPNVRKLRASGSAALDLAYVAAGRLDAYIEQGVSIWDVAAGILLVQQAGGKVDHSLRPSGKIKVLARSGRIDFPET